MFRAPVWSVRRTTVLARRSSVSVVQARSYGAPVSVEQSTDVPGQKDEIIGFPNIPQIYVYCSITAKRHTAITG